MQAVMAKKKLWQLVYVPIFLLHIFGGTLHQWFHQKEAPHYEAGHYEKAHFCKETGYLHCSVCHHQHHEVSLPQELGFSTIATLPLLRTYGEYVLSKEKVSPKLATLRGPPCFS